MKHLLPFFLLTLLAFAPGCGDSSSDEESADPAHLVIDLATPSGEVEVEGAPVSVGFFAKGNGLVNLYQLTGPDGTDWTADAIINDVYVGPWFTALFPVIPVGDDSPLLEGTWRYGFGCNGCQVTGHKALIKKRETSVMKINFVFVSLPGADSQPNYLTMESHFRDIFESKGISIGDVRYRHISSADTSMPEIDRNRNGQPDGLDRLSLLTSGYGPDADHYIHVFFVSYMQGGTLGIAGGSPGPPFSGTEHSAVAINAMGGFGALGQADLVLMAETVAHEIGHQVGLYHTTEWNGRFHDPISDTPECYRRAARPAACPDGSNLMYWAGDPTVPQRHLTPGQLTVIRRAFHLR